MGLYPRNSDLISIGHSLSINNFQSSPDDSKMQQSLRGDVRHSHALSLKAFYSLIPLCDDLKRPASPSTGNCHPMNLSDVWISTGLGT